MKSRITELITEYVANYEKQDHIKTKWGTPQVGFADAHHPYLRELKTIISEKHCLPVDVLGGATIVIAYFVPFDRELALTNNIKGDISSPQWALAYEETNEMFGRMNEYLVNELKKMGYQAAVSPEAGVFDRDKLRSNWSQRHFARVAGLGTFGVNNMLITKDGCCGRYSTVVTNLDVEPDQPLTEEMCLYRKNGSCGVCVKKCPSGALTLDGYDRYACYGVCMKNAKIYTEFGNSYVGDPEAGSEIIGSEVCGKCLVGVPCQGGRRAGL